MEKLRFYILSGIAGFIFTFIFSIRNNLWTTSMARAFLAFVIWFVLAFLLKGLLDIIAGRNGNSPKAGKSADTGTAQEDERGAVLDLATPDEDEELMDMIHSENGSKGKGGFVPLNPPKLVSTKDPEELAKAVRHLAEK